MEKKEFKESKSLFEKKYRFLLLGGLGFLGKNFVEYLFQNNAHDKIVIVDKKHLKLSYITSEKLKLYDGPNIKVLQRDLSREADVKEIFNEHGPFDIVINFAAETRYSMTDEEYKKNTLKLSDVCAKVASKFNGILKYIEISSAYIYASSSIPCNESSKLDPSLFMAKMKLAAERAIFRIPNLELIILRPSIIYGPNDHLGFMTINLIASSLYKINKEKMYVMWNGDKRINTVHAEDVCRSIMYAINFGKKGDILNISDENDTSQDKFYKLIKSIFKIDVECVGTVKSYFAKLKIDGLVSEMNKKHCKWWFESLEKFDLDKNGPVNINIYKEMIENYELCVDGSAIKKLGFEYKHPKLTTDELGRLIQELIDNKYMPNIFK